MQLNCECLILVIFFNSIEALIKLLFSSVQKPKVISRHYFNFQTDYKAVNQHTIIVTIYNKKLNTKSIKIIKIPNQKLVKSKTYSVHATKKYSKFENR